MNHKIIPHYFVCAIINEQTEMKCLVKMGIDGIMTDYPSQLLHVTEKYNQRIA